MRSTGSISVLLQVALLAAFAVIASQVVAFVVVLTAPPPPPAGFSIGAAAAALRGGLAETTDGRALTRRVAAKSQIEHDADNPVANLIRATIAARLGLEADEVRVVLQHDPGRESSPGVVSVVRFALRGGSVPEAGQVRPDPAAHAAVAVENARRKAQREDLASDLAAALSAQPMGERSPVGEFHIVLGPRQQRVIDLADQLSIRPFSASALLPDGRWATVEPPRGLIDPWQARLLMALGITALLLTPVVWLMARRLTRPIRAFAEAAERLGADPDAEPLKPSGPTEVRTAIAAFNDMQAAIRRHMRQRTQTIAAIAHDLRTPLTRLRFRAEQATPALRDRMAADVEEMDALIGQALAFARGETRAERREPLDLSVLAADCVAGFGETGANVGFKGSEALPVEGDSVGLRRAVSNLIDNALKFAGNAQIAAFRLGDQAVITVSDDGPGLAAEELEAVFEPFYRGERSRNRQTGGAGLGLAIARQAARAAGGEVTLSNRTGGGLEARLILPLAH